MAKRGRKPGQTNSPSFINVSLQDLNEILKTNALIPVHKSMMPLFQMNNKKFDFVSLNGETVGVEAETKLEFNIE